MSVLYLDMPDGLLVATETENGDIYTSRPIDDNALTRIREYFRVSDLGIPKERVYDSAYH